ncbi:glycosyltransferase [Paenibacillus sp. MZ04-78.2]|uniref:methyltransferase domain-containing protein n=1 Tax=Paenibacillus sp. MZ04-78.2 TaxID=2962034 RepID=UPI0020B727FF|nr:methyltransferase domain-containing protein [Paenibacillus sp. MZ04-78.2]MCP3774581.1 glycosyltransferase [Paenibacillus sp. MZ04-78.2]
MDNTFGLSSKPTPDTWDIVANNYTLEISHYESMLVDEIINLYRAIGIDESKSLLELGSGSGHLSGLFNSRGFKVSLLDFSEKALEKSKLFFQSHNFLGEFLKGDITNLEDLGGVYDVLWNSGVMEHFDDETLLSTLISIRKKTSKYFIFLVPNPHSVPYLMFRYKLMREGNWIYGTEYLRDDYEYFLEKAGFKLLKQAYLGWGFTKSHLETVYSSDVNNFFYELIDNKLLPKDNAYLTAYVAVPDSSNLDSIIEKIDSKQSYKKKTENMTSNFDFTAKYNGIKSQEDKKNNYITLLTEQVKHQDLELQHLKDELNQKDFTVKELQENAEKISAEFSNLKKQLEIKLNVEAELEKYKDILEEQSRNLDESSKKLIKTTEDLNHNIYENALLNNVISSKENELNNIYLSHFWKIAKVYYRIRDNFFIFKIVKSLKNNGLKTTIKKIGKKFKKIYINTKYSSEYEYKLSLIIKENKNKPVIVFPPLLDWNIPLFQRPQHMAINLSDNDFLYFYCTINHYDDVKGFCNVEGYNNLYLTDQYELLLKKLKGPVIFHLYAQDSNITAEFVSKKLDEGYKILYEYLDALHEDLCTSKNNVIERHIKVLQNEKCIVVSTADKLQNEVMQYRTENFQMVTNGVDFNHFRRDLTNEALPPEINGIIQKGKPIIGYFGALAKWFDYELVEKLARERPDYEILLIGWNYDGSLDNYSLSSLENVTIIGPIDYKVLPFYSSCFSVSTIPFRINEITEATSPIKLFEYMAMGHPIVTTNLPECRKYQSVLIGHDHNSFVEQIDKALILRNDPEYQEIITSEALANTWAAKAKVVANLINENIKLT